ncbi:DUF998 domain-containing protein [Micromonospora sp. WMMD1102]|uniref:DUF998 domain-containing protein n=1 Tax=Micromonospora sp. WMMD1102 TaxID=3016105 RepID=UPI0024156241|nr:DUF998 domain-containing protein [Micromonospora sp. WMMD1102]MDG4788285.1 DUF998 domain-containing protein [Micromonospora sp. WMMD1102]
MPAVPWWAVLSAAALPGLLVIGWTVAAVRQPPGYDPWADMISALSSYRALDRLILVCLLAGLGVAHLVTAIGLRPVRLLARLVYAAGGLATVVVAGVPKVDSSTPPAHGVAAVVAFVGLAVWPAVAVLPLPHRAAPVRHWPEPPGTARDRPWVLRSGVGYATAVLMLGFGLWLATQLPDGELAGLAERFTAGSEALWPLVVALTLFRRGSRPTATDKDG